MSSAADPRPSNPVSRAEVVPITSGERLLPASDEALERQAGLERLGEQTGRILGDIAYAIGCAYAAIETRVSGAYSEVASTTRDVGIKAQNRVQHAKQERPFQSLGIIAAVAFSLGVAARIWRANS